MGNGFFSKMFGGDQPTAEPAAATHPVDRVLARPRQYRSADGVTPQRSASDRYVSPREAVTLADVYRAIEIITTSVEQLSVDVERNGEKVTAVPAIIRNPSLDMERAEFFGQTALSMAAAGNAYWRKTTGPDGNIIDLVLLNPHDMLVTLRTDKATGRERRFYQYRGEKLPADQVVHLSKMTLPGLAEGLGPIQAARAELHGAIRTRDYASNWFDNSGQPAGVLSSDQVMSNEDAKTSRAVWNNLDPDTGEPLDQHDNPSGIKVLGKGLSYDPILISPKDAQWIEAQNFNTTKIARLFGVPASLMLAAVEGNSMTYSNVEQDWLAFTRFTLMGYLRRIELALTRLAPRGQEVRFNVEGLLRADTGSRYKNHTLALGRWMTEDEIRVIENMPPLTDAQREQLANSQPAPPAQENQNA